MDKPIFITLHGSQTGNPYVINANLIYCVEETENNETFIYISGMPKPRYTVKETLAKISSAIDNEFLIKT